MKRFHLHLVSDATGETLESVAKAILVQFEGVEAVKHFWPMIRSARQMERIVEDMAEKPGLVMYTLVNPEIRQTLALGCARHNMPAISVLDPLISAVAQHIGKQATGRPGRQHKMDDAYFGRIDALHFTMAQDDGQHPENLAQADIVLVGVSRTSKTPTSIYLANRGYKTANVPLVPNIPPPPGLIELSDPLVVGLTTSPDRLIQIRRNRLRTMNEREDTDYVDMELVREEIQYARRMYTQAGWPVIDVTRRSIEETAAAVINIYQKRAEASEAEAG